MDDCGDSSASSRPLRSANPPRILIVGAGSRGNIYARAIHESTNGVLASVAEPIKYKRQRLGERYLWGGSEPSEGQEFEDWKEFLAWEQQRRWRAAQGEVVPEGVDAVFICVLDEMHKDVIVGLEPLSLHILCEKPLATSLDDCISIYKSLLPNLPGKVPAKIFSVGHVLRYSPHNILLRKLLVEENAIGEIISIKHTEPVGWWHFTHSYVRGKWRKESNTAPSLLTKSCHDIDLLLWILCFPSLDSFQTPHLPSAVSSMGGLRYFKKARKPVEAGNATNCFSCPIESDCKYSARKIYLGPKHQGLESGNREWPVEVVVPEIEECIALGGYTAGEAAVTAELVKDYTSNTPASEISAHNWFGRCVFESDNDVCDDQVVTMSWEDAPLVDSNSKSGEGAASRGAKTVVFHMIAHTKKISQRYSNIYGSDGEIYADSDTITVQDFKTGKTQTYKPHIPGGGHGGGDDGLARQFVLAVEQVKNHGMSVIEAQKLHVGCSLEEVIRSHAMVFAAEEARRTKRVVDFPTWWQQNVENSLRR
ncbi:hypothetical protein K3495_g4559 [Podosphaera aphanis]|nr:hypothetical protein K3495_g4559 [Podosphaera aphanis]